MAADGDAYGAQDSYSYGQGQSSYRSPGPFLPAGVRGVYEAGPVTCSVCGGGFLADDG